MCLTDSSHTLCEEFLIVTQMSVRGRSFRLSAPIEPMSQTSGYVAYLDKQPLDVLRLIVASLSFDDITQLCGASANLSRLCGDQIFWRDKLLRDFPRYAPTNPERNFDYYIRYRDLDLFASYQELLGVRPIDPDTEMNDLFLQGKIDFVYPLRPRAWTFGGNDVVLQPDVHLVLGAGQAEVLIQTYYRPFLRGVLTQQWGRALTPALRSLFPPLMDEEVVNRVLNINEIPSFLAYLHDRGFIRAKHTTINLRRIPLFTDDPNLNIRDTLMEIHNRPEPEIPQDMFRPMYMDRYEDSYLPDVSGD